MSVGEDQSQPVTVVGVNSPALEWLLRNHAVERVAALDRRASSLIITQPMDNLNCPAAYRGQDFTWRQFVQSRKTCSGPNGGAGWSTDNCHVRMKSSSCGHVNDLFRIRARVPNCPSTSRFIDFIFRPANPMTQPCLIRQPAKPTSQEHLTQHDRIP